MHKFPLNWISINLRYIISSQVMNNEFIELFVNLVIIDNIYLKKLKK